MKNLLCLCSALKESLVAGSFMQKNYFSNFHSDASTSETMLVHIDEILNHANISLAEVNEIAVVVGPGSFTGIRIALAIVKGFHMVHPNIQLIAVSSLQLLGNKAKQLVPDQSFVCAMDGLSGNYFVTTFDAKKQCHSPEISTQDLDSYASGLPIFSFAGELEILNAQAIQIKAEDLLNFCKEMSQKQQFVNEKELLPNYLRLSQAEEQLLLQQKKITVELAKQEDVPEIGRLSVVAFQKDSATEQIILSEFLSDHTKHFVAKQNGKVVGFLTAMFTQDECELLNIAVLPEMKRSKVGTRLLEHLFQFCKENKHKKIWLEVSEKNKEARAFYSKHQFQTISTRKHYYHDGSDAVNMLLEV